MTISIRLAALLVAGAALTPAPAAAQFATRCSSCESCTAALATTGARAELSDDIVHEGGGPCVVIKGQDARLDGLERDIRSVGGKSPVAVRVEASGVLVKNVQVAGADVGIEVAGAKQVTLFHNTVEAEVAGIRAVGTEGLRVTRSIVSKGKVGIAFGADDSGACPAGATLDNRGAVVTGTHIQGAQVGIAACDALPVLKNNVITGGSVGVRLSSPTASGSGDGAAGPWDPCVCKPALPGARAGTALFYSSGCHGCQVHEAWLPELKAAGHDVLIRPTGQENAQGGAEWDVFMDRCAPQVTDAIGIPGCVPNYVCLANDLTNKMRKGETELVREVDVGTKDQLIAYEQQCQAAAKRSYGAEGCVAHQLHDNVICGNKTDVVGAKGLERWAGIANACGTVDGYKDADSAGCSKPCPDAVAQAVVPEPRIREGAAPSPPPPPPAAVAPAPEPAAQPTPPPTASATASPTAAVPAAAAEAQPSAPAPAAEVGTSRKWMVIGLGALLLVVLVGLIWFKWDDSKG